MRHTVRLFYKQVRFMKRFFPSSMMLTPFLVKYYRHQEEYCPDAISETDTNAHDANIQSGLSAEDSDNAKEQKE